MEDAKIMEWPLGICPKGHGPRIDMNGTPLCLVCDAAFVPAPVVKEESVDKRFRVVPGEPPPLPPDKNFDPGHANMKEFPQLKGQAAPAQELPVVPRETRVVQTLAVGGTFEQQVNSAIEALKGCPMPKDLKQFKAVQKAITILEKLQEPRTAAVSTEK